jgi:predicted nucleotidyltransferase
MSTGTRSEIDDLIKGKREDILRLATHYGVSNVRVFGSFARGEARADSDLDLLVDGLENCAWGGGRLQVELQTLLGRPVDLVSVGDLHRLIRDQVLKEAIPL